MLYRIALAIVLVVSFSLPLRAQEEGPSMMERGMELFFKGLTQEMAPALEDLRGMAEQFGPSLQSFLEEMGPAFGDILAEVKDWSVYEAPEILPNGDILIRRKADPKDDVPKAPTDDDLPSDGSTDI